MTENEAIFLEKLKHLANAVIADAIDEIVEIKGETDIDNLSIQARVRRNAFGEIDRQSIQAFTFLMNENLYGHSFWFGLLGKYAKPTKLFRAIAEQDPEGWAALMDEVPRIYKERFAFPTVTLPPPGQLDASQQMPLI